jgi:hypothetical protein
MCASKWMKWLSVIALILSTLGFTLEVVDAMGVGAFEVNSLIFFLLAIWAVIVSFKKDSSVAVTAKKK